MPKIETTGNPAIENKSIYPLRAFEYADQSVDRIRRLEAGEEQKIDLPPAEKENLLAFEKSLSANLEESYKITVNSTSLYLDYFATEEGRTSLQENTKLELNSNDPIWIKNFILSNSELIASLSSATRDKLAGEALAYKNKFLLDEILNTVDAEGNISIQNIPVPQRISIMINPQKAREKIEGLRKLKRSLKEKYKDVDQLEDDSADLKLAKKEILDIYRRRANLLIMDLFPDALLIEQKRQAVGEHNLSTDEQKFLSFFEGLTDPEKNRSRLDKLIYGASTKYDQDGWKTQVPETLLPIAERVAKIGEDIALNKKEQIRAKGLDPEKILEEKIDVESRADLGEEILAPYDLLSSEPRTSYDSERQGKARGGKWQVVNLPNRTTFGVNEKRGAVLGPAKRPYNIADTLETLGHEIEGHVLQNENKKLIELEYFRKFGADSRAAIVSEAGAILVQDVISREAFGYSTVPHPHYIRAMQKKLQGGNYLECIEAFYGSQLNILQKKRMQNKMTEQDFQKEIKENLEIAINRSQRLFGTGTDFSSRKKFLTYSKNTAYLEQYVLTDKLKAVGLEKILFAGAGNLQDIATVLKYKLLDLNKIQIPKYETLKIWEREKPKYMLK